MSFVVAAVAYGLWHILGKKLGGGSKAAGALGALGVKSGGGLAAKIWWARPLMLLICSASLANTIVGVWSARLIRGVLGWLGGLVHTSGALIAGGILLLMAVGTVLDLKDKRPDGFAKTGLIVMPLLVLVATGPLASAGMDLFDSIAQAGAHGLGSMIGG